MNNPKSFLLKILFSTIVLISTLNAQKTEIPAIVTLDWLEKNIENPNLSIIDLRPKEEYSKSHIRNAVNVPGLKNLFDDKFFMPKLDFLKELFSKSGINSESLVLAYDNGEFIWAARFYWILETLGHKNVGILKVGFNKSLEKSIPLSNIEYIPKRKEFVPRVDNEKVQTKLSTLLAIGKKTIIDGRKKSHYTGKESFASRFGHIPTAENYACTQNYQVTANGNSIKNIDKLKELYKDIPRDKEIILYCDGGAEAALNYVVLQELGFKASIYDGSWLEWGNDSALPIDNPSKK
ncbi:sulfurtransferase [Poseidonibacter lekithochrous]|uniref:sulfurtransferase n=1 Tax=Poseidonibacter lekithochrous TaxID=1904463 RepID=UPI0008FC8A98|nr:rhodanese-like domain-containing protein [Poseidonibacter lekithochrous]QKJ21802.1 3-mercaptopyruvate sulfurtransferase [Poseidonibacter lekithochrous]